MEQLRKHNKVAEFFEDKMFGIVVDIGCGTGNLLEKVGKRCEAAIGIDISSQMLLNAKTRLRRERVELIRADSKALPIRSTCVDCVLTISLLDFSEDNWRAQMSELKRIAKTTGTLAFTIFHADERVLKIEQLGLPRRTLVENISVIETLYVVRPESNADSRPSKAASVSYFKNTS